MKHDPLKSPIYDERKKLCVRTYDDPSGAMESDGVTPVALRDIMFCPLT